MLAISVKIFSEFLNISAKYCTGNLGNFARISAAFNFGHFSIFPLHENCLFLIYTKSKKNQVLDLIRLLSLKFGSCETEVSVVKSNANVLHVRMLLF